MFSPNAGKGNKANRRGETNIPEINRKQGN